MYSIRKVTAGVKCAKKCCKKANRSLNKGPPGRGVRHLYKSRTPCQQINSKSTRTNHKSICKWEFRNINISQKY